MKEISTNKKEDIDPIYSGDLSYNIVKNNPVLRPVSVMNNSHENFELIIRNALFDFEKDKEKINEIVNSNPTYSQTILVSKLNDILRVVKTLVHSLDCQKENMKEALIEMIKIVEEEYAPLSEDAIPSLETTKHKSEISEEPKVEKPQRQMSEFQEKSYSESNEKMQEVDLEKKESTNTKEEIIGKTEERPEKEKFNSSLTEKEVTRPRRQKFIPIKNK